MVMRMSGEDELLQNTIDEEKTKVFNTVCRVGPKLSGLMLVSGLIVLAFGIYLFFMVPDSVMSVRLSFVFTAAVSLVGALNILCGLLLLIGEEKHSNSHYWDER
jgi:hypothetical protein